MTPLGADFQSLQFRTLGFKPRVVPLLFGKFAESSREGSGEREILQHRLSEFPRPYLPQPHLARVHQGLRPDPLQALTSVEDPVVDGVELDQAGVPAWPGRQLLAQMRVGLLPFLNAVAQTDAGLNIVDFIEPAAHGLTLPMPQILNFLAQVIPLSEISEE